jgi:3-phenylpropionate/trans-cinnamate dioxygenase ferredoxin subunit
MSSTRRRIVLGTVDSFPLGSCRRVDIDRRPIAVFHLDEGFFAVKDSCPHQGAALSEGVVVGQLTADAPGCYRYESEHKRIRCPWHGWEYDLRTGQSSFDPARNRVRSYPVSVEQGARLAVELEPDETGRVPGPFTAETFPVTIEHDYVIIEL